MIDSVFFPPLWVQAVAALPVEHVLFGAVVGLLWVAVKLIAREGLTR